MRLPRPQMVFVLVLPLALAACMPEESIRAQRVPPDAMSGAVVRALISGNHLTGAISGRRFTFAYHPNGDIVGTIGRDFDWGRWNIEGDDHCHTWRTFWRGVQTCYQWTKAGEGYRLVNIDAFRTTNIAGTVQQGIPPGH